LKTECKVPCRSEDNQGPNGSHVQPTQAHQNHPGCDNKMIWSQYVLPCLFIQDLIDLMHCLHIDDYIDIIVYIYIYIDDIK